MKIFNICRKHISLNTTNKNCLFSLLFSCWQVRCCKIGSRFYKDSLDLFFPTLVLIYIGDILLADRKNSIKKILSYCI